MEKQENSGAERTLRAHPSASRRSFLRLAALTMGAGAVGLTGCVTPVAPGVGSPQTVEVTRVVEVTRPAGAPAEGGKPAQKLPWPYVALDVEQTRKYGHLGFYEGECCYGAFSAIMRQLIEKVGPPYDQFPVEVMKFGAGGIAGQGTICGALLGSAVAISLVVEPAPAKKMIRDLLNWYSQTPFPGEVANQYAVAHEFLVEEYKSDQALPQSVSHSPLCHVSVSEWCKVSRFASGSKEREERCGRLAGDVAAHTVELLNAHLAGSFAATYQLSGGSQMCTACHVKGENFEIGNFTQGQPGECLICHEPHPLSR